MNKRKKKLIEVALPLEVINKESEREKSIRQSHPFSLHLWWARRPLVACRAVIFASLVDDPSSHPEKFPKESQQEMERRRLFAILEDLIKWENSDNEDVLKAARDEIMKSTNGSPPPILDPFCGGGSIPLEAQRLGLEAHGSDLNPVAVLITKTLVEILPKFSDRKPVNPKAKNGNHHGYQGLAIDLQYYGQWICDQAFKKIGEYYPKIILDDGSEAAVISWIWARTVKCPNPACGCEMPLVRSFELSRKKGKEAYVDYEVIRMKGLQPKIKFLVKQGKGPQQGSIERKGAKCIACQLPVKFEYIRAEAKAKRLSQKMMAVVAEGRGKREYLSPNDNNESIALKATPKWAPETELPEKALGFRVQAYGMTNHTDLFTSRQLLAMTTFCDLVSDVREKIIKDAIKAGMKDDGKSLENGGKGAPAYADSVSILIAFLIDKLADLNNSLCRWEPIAQCPRQLFGRQAISMVWDFAEANPFSSSSGSFISTLKVILGGLKSKGLAGEFKKFPGTVKQKDAREPYKTDHLSIITDPPYYDNIGYADLSDFFYVWLRRSLKKLNLSFFQTVLVPKVSELIASPYRFSGDKFKAQQYFEDGFLETFKNHVKFSESYPTVIFYAFKQTEKAAEDQISTGWATMLGGLIEAGLSIVGTWPIRTENKSRMRGQGSNALASSIAVVCRKRGESKEISKKDFVRALKREMPRALHRLYVSNIPAVDLAQSSIGPGISIFSSYPAVIESDGSKMSVNSALLLINRMLEEFQSESDGDYDSDTLWALSWYKEYCFDEQNFGSADTLARARNTSVEGLVESGIAEAKGGKVKLVTRKDIDPKWNPEKDKRLTIWEITQHLTKTLEESGEVETAKIISKLGSKANIARDLAYRLYSIAEKKNWFEEARSYNALIVSWSDVLKLSA